MHRHRATAIPKKNYRLSPLLALLALCTGSLAFAADPPPKTYKIAAQSVSTALKAFAAQSNLQLIYTESDVGGAKTTGISGTHTPREALAEILKGTGLAFEFTANNVVVVRKASAMAAAASDPDPTSDVASKSNASKEGDKSSSSFRVAQVDQAPAGPQVSDDQNLDKNKKKEERLSEIVVTGTRIPTVAGNEVQPVLSYTRADIANSGQTTIGDFLNTLPDVSTFANPSVQLGYAGAQTVQLHGLPIGTTLSLLDGQRLETNIAGFFDLSNIPLAAVDRIDLLPVGASAIYGADALGGAVNTILRKDFDGFEANATLQHAIGVNDPSVNLAWGKSWERGSVSLIGTYQETGELLGAQREPWSSTRFPVAAPASTISALGSDSCAPGNVYSVDGSNLPGLSAPYAAIPAGIVGKPTIGQFAGTAGKQNICNAERYVDITPQSQREGALLSAHYDVAESIELFTDVLFSHQNLRNQLDPQLQFFQATVAANNPYNPFGEAVNVSFAYPGSGTVEVESKSLVRPLIGVRGSVFSDWHYEVTAYLSKDRLDDVHVSQDFIGSYNALSSSNPATALNPFTSGAPGTPQLLSSLMNPAVDSSSLSFEDQTVRGQGILRGPLLELPAGAMQAVIGTEYSQEKQDTISGGTPFFLQRHAYAAFTEARIPLLAGDERSQGGERLALTLAGRYDHSNDYGGKTTWQSGLLWRATDTLSLRSGYGVSYEAPQLSQISGPQSVFDGPVDVPDPFRGNQLITYPVAQVFGPNFHLKPETGDSFTLGLEYSSRALPGLHASLTWYNINISNFIGSEAVPTLLAYPSLFPGAVVRAPPTPQDQQQGFLGAITQLNEVDYNFGDIHVAGFDANIRYAIDTRAGEFTPSVSVANVYRWQSALLPQLPEVDAVGTATIYSLGGGPGWSPRWKGAAALAWKQGPLSVSLAGRYISRYLDYQLFVPNTNEIGNSWVFDFNARYEIGQALASTNPWLARSYIAFGAINLFNRTPPFSYTQYWYDIQEYDIRGRILNLNVGLRF
jgi:iron complex outermembrane recepter protein